MMAASPVIGADVRRLIGISDFCTASVAFIEAHVLDQAAASLFTLEFNCDRGVRSVGITGIETVNTAVLELNGGFCGIFHLYDLVTVVMYNSF